MGRPPEIGNVQIYPQRPLRESDRNGYILKFYCPIQRKRIRRNAGTRDRTEARRILRECRERLLNGEYIASGGAITARRDETRQRIESILSRPGTPARTGDSTPTWDECVDRYLEYKRNRTRKSAYAAIVSRLKVSRQIIEARVACEPSASARPVSEYVTLESLEHLQNQLLEGECCRHDRRSPMTVNTTIGAVMAFVRYLVRHRWINGVPPIEKLVVEEPMKGRPLSEEEFHKMLDSVKAVVGAGVADSWKFTLQVLWETGFRIQEVMNFSWDDQTKIHPVWPDGIRRYPTLAIPASQKNGRVQEIPMLPGLLVLLDSVEERDRKGWIVNPQTVEFERDKNREWVRPTSNDLKQLMNDYSNLAIARACGVSEASVRKWCRTVGVDSGSRGREKEVPQAIIREIWSRGLRQGSAPSRAGSCRLSVERVGRIISRIGQEARIVVRVDEEGRAVKYASAHDIRRGCALRLINDGVSAETLKLVLRHSDFATTEKFYGAVRSAQAAAREINSLERSVGPKGQLSISELENLRDILNRRTEALLRF